MSHRKSRKRRITPDLKLRAVRQALLVLEHLSFRRAANALGIRQSAVSRGVRGLEDELGVSLFERHHTGVRVTNAGNRFFRETREAVVQFDHAVESARTAGGGTVGQVSIGILSSMATGFLRDLVQLYRSYHPGVSLQIVEGASADNITAVRRRRLDVAFIADTTDTEGCETLPLWTERIVVVLPENHPLREKKQIEWSDLRGQDLIARQCERDPVLCDRLTKRITEAGHSAPVRKLEVGRETLMHLVAMGFGTGLTSQSTVATPFPRVVFRPIAGDDELLQFNAAWLPHNDNPALRQFLSLARRIAKEKRRGGPSGGPPFGPPVVSGISLSLASLGALARRLGLLT